MGQMSIFINSEKEFLGELARRIVPESASCNEREREEMFRIIEEAIAGRGKKVARQLSLFLYLLRLLFKIRRGKEDDLLGWFQNGPIPILRKGFWGLKTLIYLGYYGRPEVGPTIRYQPSFQGNEYLSKRI